MNPKGGLNLKTTSFLSCDFQFKKKERERERVREKKKNTIVAPLTPTLLSRHLRSNKKRSTQEKWCLYTSRKISKIPCVKLRLFTIVQKSVHFEIQRRRDRITFKKYTHVPVFHFKIFFLFFLSFFLFSFFFSLFFHRDQMFAKNRRESNYPKLLSSIFVLESFRLT